MTMTAGMGSVTDPVLRRLGGAAWRALPALVLLAVASFIVGFATMWVMRDALLFVPVVVVGVLSPLVAAALESVHRELFDDRTTIGPLRRTGIVACGLLVPVCVATWSAVAAGIADASESVYFQIIAVVTVVVAAVLALVAVVAVPVASMRADIRLRTVVTFALLGVSRKPWASVSVLAVTAAVGWLGLTVFTGLLALASPLLVVLSVAAAWPTVRALGVALPVLAPIGTMRSEAGGVVALGASDGAPLSHHRVGRHDQDDRHDEG